MSGTIESQIRQFISERFRRSALGEREPLLGNGIIDSLGVLDLVSFMETTFAVTVMDEELVPENFQTIERLRQFIENKRNGTVRL